MIGNLATYAVLTVAPTAVYAIVPKLVRAAHDRRERGRTAREALIPTGEPIERIAADLRRLTATLETYERGVVRVSAAKRFSTLDVYDGRLADACRALEIDQRLAEIQLPQRSVERRRVEGELIRAGLYL